VALIGLPLRLDGTLIPSVVGSICPTCSPTSTVVFEDSIRQHPLGPSNTGAHSWQRLREEIFIDHWG